MCVRECVRALVRVSVSARLSLWVCLCLSVTLRSDTPLGVFDSWLPSIVEFVRTALEVPKARSAGTLQVTCAGTLNANTSSAQKGSVIEHTEIVHAVESTARQPRSRVLIL